MIMSICKRLKNITRLSFISLAPRRCEWNFYISNLQLILMIDGWGIPCEIVHRWMSLNSTDGPTLVHLKAWRHEATSHHLSLCWLRSVLFHDVTRPQCVKWLFLFHHTVIMFIASTREYVTLTAITRAIILATYLESSQLIGRSDTRRFHLRVPRYTIYTYTLYIQCITNELHRFDNITMYQDPSNLPDVMSHFCIYTGPHFVISMCRYLVISSHVATYSGLPNRSVRMLIYFAFLPPWN